VKIPSSLLVALVALVANLLPSLANSVQNEATTDPLVELSERYLERLCANDLDGLGELLAKDALFEDPTRATLNGQEERIQGRAAILKSFGKRAEHAAESRVEIVESFVTGEHVIMRLNYLSTPKTKVIRAGSSEGDDQLVISTVTVLQIHQGKVVHHVDYVDYASILRAAAQDEE